MALSDIISGGQFFGGLPGKLVGLICSSCGLGFTCEQELREHQLRCRSSVDFLSQFESADEFNKLN